MRILFIHPRDFFAVRGATEAFYVHEHLAKTHSVETIVPAGPDSERDMDTVHSPRTPRPLWLRWIPFYLFFDIQALRTAIRLDPDSVDVLWTYRGLFLTPLWIRWRYGCHWIIDIRAPPVEQELDFDTPRTRVSLLRHIYYRTMKSVYQLAIPYADQIIAVSPALKEYLSTEFGLPESRIYVQPLGVDLDTFARRRHHEFDRDDIRIVYLTSIAEHRGFECLFRALRQLQDEDLYPTLDVVGGGSDAAIRELKDVARELNVADQVEWMGMVPHERVPRVLEQYDIGVSPLADLFSYRVASPTKVFEYLAMELIVVASDIRAHRELIEDGGNGLLVPPEDPDAWADAIYRVAENATLRETMRSRSRRSVEEYDWPGMLTALADSVLPTDRDLE